jgi:hypothetical protein
VTQPDFVPCEVCHPEELLVKRLIRIQEILHDANTV